MHLLYKVGDGVRNFEPQLHKVNFLPLSALWKVICEAVMYTLTTFFLPQYKLVAIAYDR